MKKILTVSMACFLCLCAWLIFKAAYMNDCTGNKEKPCILLQQTAAEQNELPVKIEQPQELPTLIPAKLPAYGAENAPAKMVTMGSIDPQSEFEFQLELSSQGASIYRATMSRFDDRDYKNPQPLVLLAPVSKRNGSEWMSLANKNFIFVKDRLQFPLDRLQWQTSDLEKDGYGAEKVTFSTTLKNKTNGTDVVKLTKTYTVRPSSYLLDCVITVENRTASDLKVMFDLAGPMGFGREGFRADMRKVVAVYRDQEGKIVSSRLDIKKLRKAENISERRLIKPNAQFLWAAVVNKYFAAILVPSFDDSDWVLEKTGTYYNPDGDSQGDTGDETLTLDYKIAATELPAGGQKVYSFQMYLGPKDKSLFDKTELYKKLGFEQTIDFMACCFPAAIIRPMAFGILSTMKWLHFFIPNYGIVIIILVFIVRLILHPITKKSQISMQKMGKLGPEVEKIKKKYANNKAEMQKQTMKVYKEQGASPILGILPMMLQMPLWMALWSAVYTSIELRGAAFLPFWITDLSAPDALIRFSTVTLPFVGWKIDSLNLLPLLMGVAFYLQQKLMPKPAAAATNPQVAQQQKMMMIMMPLMFPLMLYKAPSGVNLYIMASTFAGVIEQFVIRKHIREKEQAESQGLIPTTSKTGGKVKKKKPKPFFKNM